MKKVKLHLLPNAHLDPVWLWDWREGAMEAVSTCRCMVELMRRNPELTFLRGEAWVYEQLERNAPELLEEIRALIAAGRWDVVGGNYVQSDTNLPDTATFVRQFEVGKRYFREKLDVDVTAAWSADAFGQSHGLVEIFAQAGLRYYAFNRPEAWHYPLPKPLFFWRGQGGSELLCFRIPLGWYASERHGMAGRLDEYLAEAQKWDLENVAVFFGLGDHGGGASQRHIDEVQQWRREHPEAEVVFSTLHGYFKSAEEEIGRRGRDLVPTLDHEINFLQRGYYASCLKTKAAFRNAEAGLKRAAILDTLSAHTVAQAAQPMQKEWKGLLFNTFHDILPGTSIERASVEQVDWMRGLLQDARAVEFEACNRLIRKMDTTVEAVASEMPEAVPLVVFNPHPYPFRGLVEAEACMDFRPIWAFEHRPQELPVELLDEQRRPVPFQKIASEHCSFLSLPWRQRVVFTAEIPPCGWRKYTLGYVASPRLAPEPTEFPAVAAGEELKNGLIRVVVDREADALHIYDGDRELFGGALALECCRDTWGSWGCTKETPEAYLCRETLERWRIGRVKVLENGPMRAVLFVEFKGAKSTASAKISVARASRTVAMEFRVLWNEVGTRLRVVLPKADSVRYAVTGGEAERTIAGDVPGGRYLYWRKADECVGIVTDNLCCFGNYEDRFGLTVIRGSRYAIEMAHGEEEFLERPACDLGEHLFKIAIVSDADATIATAGALEMPPIVAAADRHPGSLPTQGTMLELDNPAVRLIDVQSSESGIVATLQQLSSPSEAVSLVTPRARCEVKVPFGKIIKVKL